MALVVLGLAAAEIAGPVRLEGEVLRMAFAETVLQPQIPEPVARGEGPRFAPGPELGDAPGAREVPGEVRALVDRAGIEAVGVVPEDERGPVVDVDPG